MNRRLPLTTMARSAAAWLGLALALSVLLTLLLGSGAPALAQFRTFTPIASPGQDAKALPNGAVAVEQFVPVPREVVEPELAKVIAKWNTPQMADTLAEEFFDRTRLVDSLSTQAPRDAKLRLQSVQSVQTLEQYRLPARGAELSKRVSIVSATARTQLEFNSATGLVRLPGTNEFLLRITQPEPGR